MLVVALVLAAIAFPGIATLEQAENVFFDESAGSGLRLDIGIINGQNTTMVFTITNTKGIAQTIAQNESQEAVIEYVAVHRDNENGNIESVGLYGYAHIDENGGNIIIPPYGKIVVKELLFIPPDESGKRYDVYSATARAQTMLYGEKLLPEGGWQVTCHTTLLATGYWS